jgi:hypothetical protein
VNTLLIMIGKPKKNSVEAANASGMWMKIRMWTKKLMLWLLPSRLNRLTPRNFDKLWKSLVNQSCMRYAFDWRFVFWNSIHQEVASDSFCFLINSSWLLVFILYVFSFFTLIFNFYCSTKIHYEDTSLKEKILYSQMKKNLSEEDKRSRQ